MKNLLLSVGLLFCLGGASVPALAQGQGDNPYGMTRKDIAHMEKLKKELPTRFGYLGTGVAPLPLTKDFIKSHALDGVNPITGGDQNGNHFDPPTPPCYPCSENSGWYLVSATYENYTLCDYQDGYICLVTVEMETYEDDYASVGGGTGSLYYTIYQIVDYLYCEPADFFCPDCDEN